MKLKWFAMLLGIGFLLGSLHMAVLADEVLNPDRPGSIEIAMRYDHEAVPGGSLTLYRVGELSRMSGRWGFVLTEAFADSRVSLENIEQPALAATLFAFAQEHAVSGVTKEIGADGTIAFEQLSTGLYLLAQETAAPGYEAVEPFLMSVPIIENGTYLYNIQASPKVAPQKEPTSVAPPDQIPSDTHLPQTGQRNWPIPILAASGLLLLSCGWLLCFGKRRTHEE